MNDRKIHLYESRSKKLVIGFGSGIGIQSHIIVYDPRYDIDGLSLFKSKNFNTNALSEIDKKTFFNKLPRVESIDTLKKLLNYHE